MKAFVLALGAAAVIALGASLLLNNIGYSSAADGTSSSNVRLD